MDDLTPWEDINPPMVSAPRPAPPSPYSDLTPATAEEFRNELTACLALVVPVGMSEESRRDWLRVAWGTLKNWPADLLRSGCADARKTCDHPAKIVPAIVEATGDMLERRRDRARGTHPTQPRLAGPSFQPCTPEQAAEILDEFPGLKPETRESLASKVQRLGPPRKPTRADYIAMGVDPTTLDATT